MAINYHETYLKHAMQKYLMYFNKRGSVGVVKSWSKVTSSLARTLRIWPRISWLEMSKFSSYLCQSNLSYFLHPIHGDYSQLLYSILGSMTGLNQIVGLIGQHVNKKFSPFLTRWSSNYGSFFSMQFFGWCWQCLRHPSLCLVSRLFDLFRALTEIITCRQKIYAIPTHKFRYLHCTNGLKIKLSQLSIKLNSKSNNKRSNKLRNMCSSLLSGKLSDRLIDTGQKNNTMAFM